MDGRVKSGHDERGGLRDDEREIRFGGRARGHDERRGDVTMTHLITEDMMVPSEPGIEIFVRNKRPANLAKYTPERTLLFVHGSTYPAPTGVPTPLVRPA